MDSDVFLRALAADAELRDGCVAWLNARIAAENTLDRVGKDHSIEHQQGRVAELRHLKQSISKMDEKKEKS